MSLLEVDTISDLLLSTQPAARQNRCAAVVGAVLISAVCVHRAF